MIGLPRGSLLPVGLFLALSSGAGLAAERLRGGIGR